VSDLHQQVPSRTAFTQSHCDIQERKEAE
jgi:hypothetical protein